MRIVLDFNEVAQKYWWSQVVVCAEQRRISKMKQALPSSSSSSSDTDTDTDKTVPYLYLP